MSSTLEQEKYIDNCLKLFDERMTGFTESGEVVDLGKWLWNYTFDVIGELFFGNNFGFMEKDHDHEGWMEMLDNMFPVMIISGLLPRYLRFSLLLGSLLIPRVRKGITGLKNVHKASVECVARKQRQMEQNGPTRQDVLAKAFNMYQADLNNEKKTNRQKMLLADVQNEAVNAIGAGSETTAIALRSILHNLLTHPACYSTLISEIAAADSSHSLSRPYVRYSEALKLPYMIACCKEGMRLHPSIALSFPREIPAGGTEIAGTFLPAGYKVGINPAVVQYNQAVFGEDVEAFRPERWLNGDTAEMERCMMVFGSGKRTCIGINIALVEIYKLVPQFLRDFHVELTESAAKGLRMNNIWFHRQYGFDVKLKKRDARPANESC